MIKKYLPQFSFWKRLLGRISSKTKPRQTAPPPTAQEVLKQQKHRASIASLCTTLAIIAVLVAILAFVLVPGKERKISAIVTYVGTEEVLKKAVVKQSRPRFQEPPSPPPSASSKVIISNRPDSSFTVDVGDQFSALASGSDLSLDLGTGDSFGEGWDGGDGFGHGNGASFFGQRISAEKIVYVLDFSGSMSGSREKLMRKEVTESLDLMRPGLQLGLIYFSSVPWSIGDTVNGREVTTREGETYRWKSRNGGLKPFGKKRRLPWIEISDESISLLKASVASTPVGGGTEWDAALNMALEMKPPPETIYFMTDGTGSLTEKWAEDVGRRARRMNVTINCVAMMIPEAIQALSHIARETGGLVTIVHEDGGRELVNLENLDD